MMMSWGKGGSGVVAFSATLFNDHYGPKVAKKKKVFVKIRPLEPFSTEQHQI